GLLERPGEVGLGQPTAQGPLPNSSHMGSVGDGLLAQESGQGFLLGATQFLAVGHGRLLSVAVGCRFSKSHSILTSVHQVGAIGYNPETMRRQAKQHAAWQLASDYMDHRDFLVQADSRG